MQNQKRRGIGRTTILGRDTLIDTALGIAGPTGVSDLRTGMNWLFGTSSTSVIDRIAFSTTDTSTTVTNRTTTSPKATLYAAGGGIDNVTGSQDKDIMSGGGAANDNHRARIRMAA